MKWLSVNKSSFKESFELREDENLLADISFSKQTKFVRIVSNLGKRIFSFEKEGFLNPKKIIKNEYGIKMGKMEVEKHAGGKGTVVLDGKKYSFVFNDDNSGDLILYDEMMKKNLLSCNFKSITNTISKTNSFLDTRFSSLLLVLCWYAFQPHANAVSEAMA